jgi:nicotinic acid mononucleotide adenylyltransferase
MTSRAQRRGAYPGSFNPPTLAHLAIVDAARAAHRLDHVDLIVSRIALGKPHPPGPAFDERVEVLHAMSRRVGGIAIVVADAQLVAELAAGYDVVIMGADKWHQVNDPAFYDSVEERDEAVANLPTVAVVPRPPWPVPHELALHVDERWRDVSSTAARGGAIDLMVPEAATLTRTRGGWR